MSEVRRAAEAARDAAQHVATLTTEQKNDYLRDLAVALVAAEEDILRANAADLARAEEDGLSTPKLKRLGITAESLGQMAEGLRQVADLDDPVAQVTRDQTLGNGLRVTRVRCPLGVVMMIYESRPNVTIDAFSLCFKSGNACILKGGKEAQASNEALAEVIHATLRAHGLPEGALVLVGSGGREAVAELLTFNDCIDLVIPRGGETLIRYVSENSSIPTVQHFHGVCHVYVDAGANLEQALEISVTGKTSGPATCNATEAVLVHEDVAASFVPDLVSGYREGGRRGTRRRGRAHHRSGCDRRRSGRLGPGVPRYDCGREGSSRHGRGRRSHPALRLGSHRHDRHRGRGDGRGVHTAGSVVLHPGERFYALQRRVSPRDGSRDRDQHLAGARVRTDGLGGADLAAVRGGGDGARALNG